MRRIEHPGPTSLQRVISAPCRIRQVALTLAAGAPLLETLAQALAEEGAASAVLAIEAGALSPLAYVMPAQSTSPDHAVFYSSRFDAKGPAQLASGRITFGRRHGAPWLHCHALWTAADGQRGCGHILPEHARTAAPLALSGWLLDGAGFAVTDDAETHFSLFEPAVTGAAGSANAIVLRIRPNEDLCGAIEALCAQRGILRAVVRGGVGSLIGAAFDDGRLVEPHITEVFITSGEVAPGIDQQPRATIDVNLVDYTGGIHAGRLIGGANPVLVTFELVLEIVDGGPETAS
jgi:predicted DNA-binding protein with PD1-like motif